MFNNGIFAVGNSKTVFEYTEAVCKELMRCDKWTALQQIMYRIYKKYKHEIKLIKMETKYNDWSFEDDSVIWHCKKRYYPYMKYQKEFTKYYKPEIKV